MTHRKRERPGPIGRGLAAGLVALSLTAAWGHNRSPVAARLLEKDRTLAGLLSMRFQGQGSAVPPTLYLLLFGEKSSLDLVHIPAATPFAAAEDPDRTLADVYGNAYAERGDTESGAQAMADAARRLLLPPLGAPQGFWFDLDVPADTQPGYPVELKKRFVALTTDPLFWLRGAARAPELLAAEKTDWSAYDLFLAARMLRQLNPKSIYLSRLPEPGLIARHFRFIRRRLREIPPPRDLATVEVLNATETPGVALLATKVLRFKGFDVVHFGNTPTLETALRVIDRTGRADVGHDVLEALGCDGSEVLTAMETNPRASITVVLGREFEFCTKLRKS